MDRQTQTNQSKPSKGALSVGQRVALGLITLFTVASMVLGSLLFSKQVGLF